MGAGRLASPHDEMQGDAVRCGEMLASPHDEVGAAELLGHLETLFDGRGRVADHRGVGVGARAVHVARVGEEVAPAVAVAARRRKWGRRLVLR